MEEFQIAFDKESPQRKNEKINISIKNCINKNLLYKFLVGHNGKWNILKDFSNELFAVWSPKKEGIYTIMIQALEKDDAKPFSYVNKTDYIIRNSESDKVEIKNFRCLTTELYTGNEIIFKVDAINSDNKMTLYKFVKIYALGKSECIQDYSGKRIVSYTEKGYGDFKLLCMVKDMYSKKEFDDRAVILYRVKKYRDIKIIDFTADVTSPQLLGSTINLKSVVTGGKNILYRYVIDGNLSEDSGYKRDKNYVWRPKRAGIYNVKLMVKDESCKEAFEALKEFKFAIEEIKNKPVKIVRIYKSKEGTILKGETVNVKVEAKGGIDLRYSFTVKKENQIIEKIDYGACNWVNFTPSDSGKYTIEIKVKDKYCDKDFQCCSEVVVQAMDYIPAKIECVLPPVKDYYVVGEKIQLEAVTLNTKENLVKFIISKNSSQLEETNFEFSKKYEVIPKCEGTYKVEIYAVNKNSSKKFDSYKAINFIVRDVEPVSELTIKCDREFPILNEAVTLNVSCKNGREIVYQFYIMKDGEWKIVQRYSKKSFYSFIPTEKGNYRILILCKNQFNCEKEYEDYSIFEMNV
ncbi:MULTISPECIES: triple tyrosine motif-containing protein [Clostridium]|uniref:triple tyrosine motif-containing protein n=1 Tax=Clostridium TaxID=1485 RepID=UPI00069DFDB6|nr:MULTISPECIES: triple tyrosine motif-containing protein [Clostridium]KOF58092.1 hypothetical protein AGR56_00910 [Clostridium sp. DMHC 10]MCD2347733.1 triple tyrosine motif-containing protein [Clostridium guangxiense]